MVVHYDLIPALSPNTSPLQSTASSTTETCHLQRADLLLAISDYSRKEAEDFLNFLSDR